MKRLHKQIVVGALAGALVLGGALEYGVVLANATNANDSTVQSVNAMLKERDLRLRMYKIIKSHRDYFLLRKGHPDGSVRSQNYNSFEEFKSEIFKLPGGYYYNVYVERVTVSFYKKK